MLLAMKHGAAMLVLLTFIPSCAPDGSPISGDYCSRIEPTKCTTIAFPPKRGTEAPGNMLFEGKRYELSWMDVENGRRKYLTNLPSGTVAFEVSAVDPKTVVLRWRDKRPEETYALK
jgi:hypothetical protein